MKQKGKAASSLVVMQDKETILEGKVLRELSDDKLASYLFSASRKLQHALHSPPFSPSFTKEIMLSRYTSNSSPEVVQLTACVLCDIIRLSLTEEISSVGPSGAASVPFPPTKYRDVLHCIVKPFEEACRFGDVDGCCSLIVHRASSTGVMKLLLSQMQGVDTLEMFGPLFQLVGRSSQAFRSPVGSSAAPSKAGINALAVKFSRILADIISSTGEITSDHLSLLISQITTHSPGLQRRKGTNSFGVASTSFELTVATRVLLECMDTIQGEVYAFVMDPITAAFSALASASSIPQIACGESSEQEGRRQLGCIARSLEAVVGLVELHVDFVQQIFPQLHRFLMYDCVEARHLLLRGLATAYSSNPSAIPTYQSCFSVFLSHVDDIKPAIRMEMIQSIGEIFSIAVKHWVASGNTAALFWVNQREKGRVDVSNEIYAELFKLVQASLIDVQPSVRIQAVNTLADMLMLAPEFLSTPLVNLENSLGLRSADKNSKVRHAALTRLCQLYQKNAEAVSWVPNVFLLSSFEEMEDKNEMARLLEKLLDTSSFEQQRVGEHEPLQKISQGKEIPLFDFERTSQPQSMRAESHCAPSDAYEEKWVFMCQGLSEMAFQELLRIAERKHLLRCGARKLFELRQSVLEKKSSEEDEHKTMVRDIHRLLTFLQENTGAEHNEWDCLFRCRDAIVVKGLLRFCQEENQDWKSERDTLLHALKGRIDANSYAFVEKKLLPLLAVPIQQEHVQSLLQQLSTEARIDSHRLTYGVFRVLHVFLVTAPGYVSKSTSALVSIMKRLVSLNTNDPLTEVAGVRSASSALLNILKSLLTPRKGNNMARLSLDAFKEGECEVLIDGLADLCLGQVPQEVSENRTVNEAERLLEISKVSKKAAWCLRLLKESPCIRAEKKNALLEKKIAMLLRKAWEVIRKGYLPQLEDELLTSCTFLRVLLGSPQFFALMKSTPTNTILKSLCNILMSLVQAVNSIPSSVSGLRKEIQVERRIKIREIYTVLASSVCKALAAILQSLTESARIAETSHVTDFFLSALESLESFSRGSASSLVERAEDRRGVRLAVLQQLAKLLRRPGTDMRKEIALVVALSSEKNILVRRVLQEKIASHICRNACDMRYVAVLFLFALQAGNKQEYQELQRTVQGVSVYLQHKKSTNEQITLSSVQAMGCYMEHALPFLVLFLSRHPMYVSQEEKYQFVAYQRVWHLFFEELLRQGTECVSFLMDLLTRIKHSKDVFQDETEEENRSRVLAELGIAVFQQQLAKCNFQASSLERYPGSILLPNFFIPSASRSSLEERGLRSDITVPAHVPFRLLSPGQSSAVNTPLTSPAVSSRISLMRPREDLEDCDVAEPQEMDDHASRARESSEASSLDSPSRKQRKTEPFTVCDDSSLSVQEESESSLDKTFQAARMMVRKLTAGLSKSKIAALQWMEVKNQVKTIYKSLSEETSPASEQKFNELADFVKLELRDVYNAAEDI